jgi:hypothetical protein
MNEPIDLARSTWSRGTDWCLLVAAFAVLFAVLSAAAGSDGFLFAGLGGVVGMYLVSWWRGSRMGGAFDAIDRAAARGRLSLLVRVKSGSFVQFIGSGRDGVLTIEDGTVRLRGQYDEAWPASTVRIGRQPNWFANRGIELLTPSGSRWISSVRTTDPAMYVSAWLDGRTVKVVARVLAVNASAPPPGWYPDPAGAPTWRWWDGVQWGATSDTAPPSSGLPPG